MKSINLKKLILPNLPYLLFVYLFDKVGQAVRLAPGADLSGKLLTIGDGFAAAFSSFAPSLHPADLLVGILGAALIRLIVYVKGKNAKKYRRGVEYGGRRRCLDWRRSRSPAQRAVRLSGGNVLSLRRGYLPSLESYLKIWICRISAFTIYAIRRLRICTN